MANSHVFPREHMAGSLLSLRSLRCGPSHCEERDQSSLRAPAAFCRGSVADCVIAAAAPVYKLIDVTQVLCYMLHANDRGGGLLQPPFVSLWSEVYLDALIMFTQTTCR